ncbi:beta-hexosaminidase [Capnocytophaga cynodegmi]|uniref:glycoside hydrolase family 20 protein n=1 Tax=Capnocytophaga cynodegmi TaxID=28189 RepID=UPI001AD5A6FE|nr:glycoside hydrolase family 20 protein [Capnocytophaga cynodegmi]GIM50973.1 beta-hexosaminidase [Capnocytophaga cynodegmi]
MKKIILPFLLLAIGCQTSKEITFEESDINIIPKPKNISLSNGYFEFTSETTFVTADTLQNVARLITEKFKKASGWDLKITNEPPKTNFVVLETDTSLPNESYTFNCDNEKITIKAYDRNGFIYALQTLRQLLPKEIESSNIVKTDWIIPSVNIQDQPQYPWRGLMLDVARHFFPKEYILKTIDRMAMLKLNTFHFHLIDNEGWRIEIKKYPKLTEVGAWRVDQEEKHWNARSTNSPETKGTYGGFYTQEDIKEIVSYASERGITIIPEIEMPAHVMSAIAAYPELSCHKRPIGVPSGGVWPITDIYCAGQDETFTFLEDVLTEVMDLFPSKYIHIGGDEATHTEWEKCPKCLQRMKEHKLKNAHELQSYFIKRIDNFLVANGRRLVGWDEIIEGGLPPQAIVMNWRGIDIGKKAIEQGHQVVLTSDCYIDQYQGSPDNEPLAIGGYLPLSKIYNYSLHKDELTQEQQKQILGSQANLWAEYIPNEKHSEYMIFPRLLALAEVVWTPQEMKNWNNFMNRVQKLLPRLELMNINYSKSMYQVSSKIENQDNKVIITLHSELPEADIRYSLNGDLSKAQKYTQPIEIKETTTIKSAVFFNEKPNEVVYSDTIVFHKVIGKKAAYNPVYHKSYQGQGNETLTNIVRGTKNFHDKQWLAWLVDDASVIIDLEEDTEIEKVIVGAMENQGSGIYFPTKIDLLVSVDGKNYTKIGEVSHPHTSNGYAVLKDFKFDFEKQKARFVKLEIQNLGHPPKGGDSWMFIDEIQIF